MSSLICGKFIYKIFTALIMQNVIIYSPASAKHNFSNAIVTFNANSVPISSKFYPIKRWQVGRVSRKHYEIINMLWRKSKKNVNLDTTTSVESRFRKSNQNAAKNTEHIIRPLTYASTKPTSTSSYIEFYYLDDIDERIKRKDFLISAFDSLQHRHSRDNKNLQSFDNSSCKNGFIQTSSTSKLFQSNTYFRSHIQPENFSMYEFWLSKPKLGLIPELKNNTVVNYTNLATGFSNLTCPSTITEPENSLSTKELLKFNNNKVTSSLKVPRKNAPYDKIKFFEMYDQLTLKPLSEINEMQLNLNNSKNMLQDDDKYDDRKLNLQNVDQISNLHEGNNVKNNKKHFDKVVGPRQVNNSVNKKDKTFKFKTVSFNINNTITEHLNNVKKVYQTSSREVAWSDYPFAAIFVYEPSQIFCDAAALSPHWLVAAGSCLSRYSNERPGNEGSSPFVAYCGQKWWKPERLSYVKYILVHPRFHPNNITRRLLYNIGLIKVVGSMSSCSGWSPITLMSHHFAVQSTGFISTAVGWGLDRYDVRYSHVELPNQPLSAYNAFLYSETCPGSNIFGNGKSLNEEERFKNNLYCLSLPVYSGEQNDPVHGSLLLVGGKLIALYLQEERRLWGEQSALYTGVWKLVPWVHAMVREQDDVEGFVIDL